MIRYLIFAGFYVRVLNTYVNSYITQTPGSGMDARGFHGFASEVSNDLVFDTFGIGFTLYTNFLGFIYYLTIDSIFVGGLVSCFFWLLSAILLFKTLKLFKVSNNFLISVFLIYSFLPSSIFFTSITLREVFQLFLINLSLYSYTQIYLNRKYSYYISFLLGIILMSTLHGALLLFGASLFFLAVVSFLINQATKDILKKYLKTIIVILIFIIPIGIYSINTFTQISNSYDISEGIFIAVEAYQNILIQEDARSNYISEYEFSSFADFLTFMPFNFFQYFMEPFPWKIQNLFDLVVFSENFLRLIILYIIISFITNVNPNFKPLLYAFLGSYLFLELVWSIGTVNWGTAIRHHVPSLGILLTLFSIILAEKSVKKRA